MTTVSFISHRPSSDIGMVFAYRQPVQRCFNGIFFTEKVLVSLDYHGRIKVYD